MWLLFYLYEGKSGAQSIFIWEACLELRQIFNQIELTNRFNEILFYKTVSWYSVKNL